MSALFATSFWTRSIQSYCRGRFVSYGSGLSYLYEPRDFGFNRDDMPDLPEGKYVGIGASKAVRIVEGLQKKPTVSVTIDGKLKSFFHVTVSILLNELFEEESVCL